MFIGLIQAFIFALLTVLYFAMAGEGHDDDDEHDEDARRARGTRRPHGRNTEETPALAH